MSRTDHHGDKQKQKKFGDNWHWFKNEPKSWRKLYKHKKRRSAVRQCVYDVMAGSEEVFFPLDKKPWIYYW